MTLRFLETLAPGFFSMFRRRLIVVVTPAPSIYVRADGKVRDDYEGHAMANAYQTPDWYRTLGRGQEQAVLAPEQQDRMLMALQDSNAPRRPRTPASSAPDFAPDEDWTFDDDPDDPTSVPFDADLADDFDEE